MKANPILPLRWITLPRPAGSPGMRTKQFILASLMVITACAALLIFAPSLIGKNRNPNPLAERPEPAAAVSRPGSTAETASPTEVGFHPMD